MKTNIKIAGLIVFMSIFNLFGNQKYELAEIYTELRDKVLNLTPSEIGAGPNEKILAVLMETAYSEAIVTLAIIKDGSTSLYFSNGGGIIGNGQSQNISDLVKKIIKSADSFSDKLTNTTKAGLPKLSNTSFHFVTQGEILSITDKEINFGNNKSPISELFHQCHELITLIREMEENKNK